MAGDHLTTYRPSHHGLHSDTTQPHLACARAAAHAALLDDRNIEQEHGTRNAAAPSLSSDADTDQVHRRSGTHGRDAEQHTDLSDGRAGPLLQRAVSLAASRHRAGPVPAGSGNDEMVVPTAEGRPGRRMPATLQHAITSGEVLSLPSPALERCAACPFTSSCNVGIRVGPLEEPDQLSDELLGWW